MPRLKGSIQPNIHPYLIYFYQYVLFFEKFVGAMQKYDAKLKGLSDFFVIQLLLVKSDIVFKV